MKADNNKSVSPKKCILEEDKICDNCCECFVCDLDPAKTCDNCARCLELSDFSTIIISDDELPKKNLNKSKFIKIKKQKLK